jgi:tRNA threonylcarbamoyladenosine biosynthesis protein TsaE
VRQVAEDRARAAVKPPRGRHQSTSATETEALARELACSLVPGDVVLLEGELGAGKTTFVRGACRALGVSGPVRSPTFTIGALYPAAVPVAHVDLYRLSDLRLEDPELLADYLRADTIAFVEWPAEGLLRLAAPIRIAYRVRMEHADGEGRTVTIT